MLVHFLGMDEDLLSNSRHSSSYHLADNATDVTITYRNILLPFRPSIPEVLQLIEMPRISVRCVLSTQLCQS